MSKAKTEARERMKLHRALMIRDGFKRLEMWARPSHHQRIKDYATKLEKKEGRGK